MRKLLKIAFIMICPCLAVCQIEVKRVLPTTIVSFLPIPNVISTPSTSTITFQFTPPTIPPFGVPDSLNVDSTYNISDDSTHEYSPKLQYGMPLNTRISMLSGNWQIVGTMNIWSLKVIIQNALNTSATFSNFTLSPTAKLYIVNGENTIIKGPFVKEVFNNIPQFGTFPMDGNTFTILLYEPNNGNISQNNISINQVVAGYQSLSDYEQLVITDTIFNKKDPLRCINSIRCYPSWMTAARSVARWVNGGQGLCTGTLLNNENQNGIAFFYSACHCLPADRTLLRNASFQFQFWQTDCNNGAAPRFIEFFGATLLHEESQSNGDQALMRLNNGPGVGDAPTYAGWNRDNANPSAINAGIIHHPSGSNMRFTKPNNIRDYLWNSNFWKINYNDGVTRPGSSGSAIFNDNQQAIGTLSAGLSKCGWKQTVLGDRYGKFHTSWNGTQTFLSPTQNIQSIPSLKLNPIQIVGNAIIGCATTTETYSVPNLIGCTYDWTTSNNLQITLGAGTNRITVLYNSNGNPLEIAWVNVRINDNKGTIPDGRRVEVRLNLQVNRLIGTTSDSYYNYNSLVSPLIVFYPEGYGGRTVNWKITDPTITSLGWTAISNGGPDVNITTTPTSLNAHFTGQGNGQIIYDFRYSGPCGIITKRFEASGYLIPESALQLTATPNPVTNNILINIERKTEELKNIAQSENLYFELIDVNTKQNIKNWIFKNNQNQYNLAVSEIKFGAYIIKVTLAQKSESIKIIKL